RRPKNLVQPRYEAYWLIKRNTSLTLPTIGRLLGGRDHTTILHGVRRYETARGEILKTGTMAKSGGWDLSKMILNDGYIDIEKEGI
ncbi:MAG: hypothetical protein JKX91_01335, partial [Rhizobiaceae bacterium]|nr:hypothetical protein [Rhizobiaceae bacterium]